MASISGTVTIAGDPDDWIAVAWDAATHAYAGVATVSGGAYEITGLTAGKAYIVGCRPKTGGVWQGNTNTYTLGDYALPTDTVTTPYLFKATTVVVGDDLYDSVTLQLHCNGTDGSATFTDEKGHTVTREDAAQIDTEFSKFGGASAKFDGAADRLVVSSNADYAWGTGDFCIEMWVRLANDFQVFFSTDYNASLYLSLQYSNSTKQIKASGPGFTNVTQSNTTEYNTWTHVAFVRKSGATRLFIDGVSRGTGTSTGNFSSAQTLYIGGCHTSIANGDNWCNGHLDDVRITNAARYWDDFTVPAIENPDGNNPTGSTEPTWPTTPGNTVVDGGVTWTNMGQLLKPLMQGPLIAT